MEYLCPQCNGMASFRPRCPTCGEFMEDKGRVAGYLDPYSPYLEQQVITGQCTHLFSCPQCGRDKRFSITLVVSEEVHQ